MSNYSSDFLLRKLLGGDLDKALADLHSLAESQQRIAQSLERIANNATKVNVENVFPEDEDESYVTKKSFLKALELDII